MSAKGLLQRLKRVSAAMKTRIRKALESMTDEELQALMDSGPPDEVAAIKALTDEELREMADGIFPARWHELLEAARRGDLQETS